MPDTVNFLFFLFIQFVVGSMILAFAPGHIGKD
jgi:hypothetical protein